MSVRRLDEGLGLAVARVTLSARTLVTYARDHVVVRTPSQPDLPAGNTLDLLTTPRQADLEAWLRRFADTVGATGARAVRLRWETPPGSEEPGADLRSTLRGRGLGIEAAEVLLLSGRPAPGVASSIEIGVLVAPGTSSEPAPTIADERRWHAAGVLLRYARGTKPEDWRSWDAAAAARQLEIEREQVAAGRARIWLASRHGGPVARVALVDDRQGLAAVDGLVVHPAHRRRGIARALVTDGVEALRASDPTVRVGVVVPAGSSCAALFTGLGFEPQARIWTVGPLEGCEAGGTAAQGSR